MRYATRLTAVLTTGILSLSTGMADANTAADSAASMTVASIDDTYAIQERPAVAPGRWSKFVAENTTTRHNTAYLKFDVRGIPADATGVSVRLALSSDRAQPERLQLHTVESSSWMEETLTYRTAPAVGGVVAEVVPPPSSTDVTFDLSGVVQRDGLYSFAITAPLAGSTTSFFGHERRTGGPRLAVTWDGGSASTPVSTLFGAAVQQQGGERYGDALARSTAAYGALDVVRLFYPGLPGRWSGAPADIDGPLIVSFKALPTDVIAGKHDAHLRDWFASAPVDRPVWWSYFHEPEDDIQRGAFTAAEYRAAWAHIEALSHASRSEQLHSTLILMCWTLEKLSGRDWRDYYAGDSVVDMFGWDCYNTGRQNDVYRDPANLLEDVVTHSAAVGKPFGIAELGSLVIPGDDGTGRAQWLRESARFLSGHGATWVSYFDVKLRHDYRLLDEPSRSAWRETVTGG